MIAPSEETDLFDRILKGLRRRGDGLDWPHLSCASDVAALLVAGDRERALARAKALGITGEELNEWTGA